MRHIDKFIDTFTRAVTLQDEAAAKRKAAQLEHNYVLRKQMQYKNVYICTGCKKTIQVTQENF